LQPEAFLNSLHPEAPTPASQLEQVVAVAPFLKNPGAQLSHGEAAAHEAQLPSTEQAVHEVKAAFP
jgi:hypothetical protein